MPESRRNLGRGVGNHPSPQILTDHLTLFQSRGQIMPTILLLAPLWFSDLPTALCPTLTSISTQSLLSIIQCATEILTHKNSEESGRILENPRESRRIHMNPEEHIDTVTVILYTVRHRNVDPPFKSLTPCLIHAQLKRAYQHSHCYPLYSFGKLWKVCFLEGLQHTPFKAVMSLVERSVEC